MNVKRKGNITDRATLRNFFGKGNRPTQEHFEKLIDSTFNKAEDRLDIDGENGLMIYPVNNGKLMSFFNDIDDADAKWDLHHSKESHGIAFLENDRSLGDNEKVEEKNPTLFLKEGGRIGVGTNDPICTLDVNGMVASQGRLGNITGTMDADGKWHNIELETKNPGHFQAYEIMALAKGNSRDGKYCLLHAIAISTYGDSHPKITKTCAHYGNWWNKISLRWESRETSAAHPEKEKWWYNLPLIRDFKKGPKDENICNLQMKTLSYFGEHIKISYRISKLWDDNF